MAVVLAFDIEANGLLATISKVHCLAVVGSDGTRELFVGDRIRDGLSYMQQRVSLGAICAGHMINRYDLPALERLYGFTLSEENTFDTIVGCRALWPDTKVGDAKAARRGTFPKHLVGNHSLEAWGHRLGCYKGAFKGPWELYTEEMGSYCLQDATVALRIYCHIQESLGGATEAMETEQKLGRILTKAEFRGVKLDVEGCTRLYGQLAQEREVTRTRLAEQEKPLCHRVGQTFTPKSTVNNYTPGAPLSKIEYLPFNPGSRQQCIKVLTRRYGWEPEEYTDDGNPKLDEDVLSKLEAPLAKELSRYFMLDKRCGSLAEGDESWLKLVDAQGYLHCETVGSGTVTLRGSHRHPNLSQVTAGGKPYGEECRACFVVPERRRFVGVDMSGLELRCLAHDLWRYDNGDFAKAVVEGDVHTILASIYWPGQEITPHGLRKNGKTVTYALLYGCGDKKLAKILKAKSGKKERARISAAFPSYAKLVEECRKRHTLWGRVPTIDKRKVLTRGAHSAINTRLQANGAVICKRWVVEMDEQIRAEGLDAHLLIWSHDEVNYEVSEKDAERVVQIGQEAARKTGEALGFRVRLDTEGHVGKSWADVH